MFRGDTKDSQLLSGDLLKTPLKVVSSELVANGCDVKVDARAGGIIAVNAVYQPFFKALADGKPVPIVPVNGV